MLKLRKKPNIQLAWLTDSSRSASAKVNGTEVRGSPSAQHLDADRAMTDILQRYKHRQRRIQLPDVISKLLHSSCKSIRHIPPVTFDGAAPLAAIQDTQRSVRLTASDPATTATALRVAFLDVALNMRL
jgi:hypothetical protein